MIGSLFSGIGGLELGLEFAGLGPVAWQVEIDPFARGVLAMHWPNANRSVIDVRQASAANLAPVDLICGGSPCQNISDAGDRTGIDGEQSGLWREMSRIIGELRPRFVVWENVAAAVGRGLDRVVADLIGHGYRVEGRVFGADDVGAPHRRKRVFVVAYRNLERCEQFGATRVHDQGQPGNDVARCDSCGGSYDDRGPCCDPFEPELGGGAHGLPDWLHRWPSGPGDAPAVWEPARAVRVFAPTWGDRLAALGNAVVPLCAYQVGMRVREIANCA